MGFAVWEKIVIPVPTNADKNLKVAINIAVLAMIRSGIVAATNAIVGPTMVAAILNQPLPHRPAVPHPPVLLQHLLVKGTRVLVKGLPIVAA